MGDLRKSSRMLYKGKVSISFVNTAGAPCSVLGECIDISEGGMRVRLKEPLSIRGFVSIRCREANLHGTASVRSCNHIRMGYMAGLEFAGGMKFETPKVS
jgi:hypothetical protein